MTGLQDPSFAVRLVDIGHEALLLAVSYPAGHVRVNNSARDDELRLPAAAHVFVHADGAALDPDRLAKPFRVHLKLAGVTRPVLFETTAPRQRIRVHDLRATFVTLALANGR